MNPSTLRTSVLPQLADVRFPARLELEEFYPICYRLMYLARRVDERLFELFQKGYVKGTVTTGMGNEATAVGMTLPFRPGRDPVAVLHRDIASHLMLGATPYLLACQYMANRESPTHSREGNCHHGDAEARRFSMLSHLGKMPSTVVGATWAARDQGESVFGLAVIGDGGSSTGEIHESMNLAAVLGSPVLFLIENNGYSFSTPVRHQYRCKQLSDRAAGYGIEGKTIDGTDPWTVYSAVCDAMEQMQRDRLPQVLECMTIRMQGHAVYDKAEYVSDEEKQENQLRDPLPRARRAFQELCGTGESQISRIEERIDEELRETFARALAVARPDVPTEPIDVYCHRPLPRVPAFSATRVKNGSAVTLALDYLLEHNERAFLAGLDVGAYGSAFKTCKGLFERFGRRRVIDLPLCESATVGFGLGASQVGGLPILEFQFADFSTEVVTQLGMNVGTWFFRTDHPAPMLLRLPCGGGLTMGAFHSGEFEGLWSRFPGLKLVYPATAQETFEALVAGFHDPNPVLVFEHKGLYWSKAGSIDFDGLLPPVWRVRQYREGDDLTVVAFGAMVHEALDATTRIDAGIDLINPFVLQPLDVSPIIRSVEKTGRLLVVQECGQTQGLGDRVISLVARRGLSALKAPPRLLASPDGPVPFAPELEMYCRPDSVKIEACINRMLGKS